jgi:isopenicillin-N N-acyltransferase-like protein
MPLPVIAVAGTPAECGAAYGAAAADLVAGNLAAYGARFARRAGLDPATVRRLGAGFRRSTRERLPRIADLLDGVAEGAGVDVDDVYALNARTELLYGAGAPGECTSVGVLPQRSADGHTLIAQNWDWHPAQQPYTVLLVTRDERGFTVATLAEAGMLAKAGLNSAGVGVAVNMLGCDRDGRAGGVPYHVLLRAVLETDALALALRVAVSSPRSASINLLLGQGHDGPGGGELVDVELVPGDVGWLHPVDGLLTHANHLETPLPVRDAYRDSGGSSVFRAARARRLLDRHPTVGVAELTAVLTDHAGFPHAICRHPDEREADDDLSATLCSVVLDLEGRRIGVAGGPPCGGEFGWLTLDAAFAAAG